MDYTDDAFLQFMGLIGGEVELPESWSEREKEFFDILDVEVVEWGENNPFYN